MRGTLRESLGVRASPTVILHNEVCGHSSPGGDMEPVAGCLEAGTPEVECQAW